MVWQKHDNAYLGATVAAGTLAAYVLSSNFGFGHGGQRPGLEGFGFGALPVPLVAAAPHRASRERLRIKLVFAREVAGAPGLPPVTAPPFPSAPAPNRITTPPAPPGPVVTPGPTSSPTPTPKPEKTPEAKKPKKAKKKAVPKPKKPPKNEPKDASGRK